MRILLMGQHYAPEEVSGSVLATELASDLTRRGHRVDYVTCAPSYPQGVVFPGYRSSTCSSQEVDGVLVIRVWSYILRRKDFWPQILNYGMLRPRALQDGLPDTPQVPCAS